MSLSAPAVHKLADFLIGILGFRLAENIAVGIFPIVLCTLKLYLLPF